MIKNRFVFLLGMIGALLVAGWGHEPTYAGRLSEWSTDSRVPGYLDDTYTPFLLPDRNRTVHVFASQWVDNQGRRLAIVYRQWTLTGGWTRPVDIMLSPVGGNADFLGAYLDASDTIHMIFQATELLTRSTSIFYSSAPAANADWAPAWSAPVLVGGDAVDIKSAAIIGDDLGNLVVLYSGDRDGNGVYDVFSKDSGRNWSTPSPVFLTYDTRLVPFSLQLTAGPDQRIKAVWSVVTILGVNEEVYFVSFDTSSYEWGIPVELERRIDLPGYFGPAIPVMVDNGREIVIMYNGGNPFTGRPVGAGRPIQRTRISKDGGLTWNEPLDPYPFHLGRSGEHALTLDGNGNPHALFIQRTETIDEDGRYTAVGGIWHSVFRNGTWSNPSRIVTTVPAHDVRAVVSQGNVLIAVWREDPGGDESGVWYTYTVLDVPEQPVVPLATVSVDFSVQPTSTTAPVLDTPVPSPRLELLDEAPPSNLGASPAVPILLGSVPVFLLLLGVIFGYRFLNGRRG